MMPTVLPFSFIDATLDSEGAAAALDRMVAEFRGAGDFEMAFEATLMKLRYTRGLPLIQTAEISDDDYQQAVVEAAREAGRLFLADGNIERAWPYFRAVGEPEPIRQALEKTNPSEGTDQLAAIAFQEGVHPAKGLEMILAQHGMCRAITAFGMTAVSKDRERCLHMLAEHLQNELLSRLTRAIESGEGALPEPRPIPELLENRDWLFGAWDYYVDTSHLLSVIGYTTELSDPATLRLFGALCAYGRKLSSEFQQPGVPPFEDQFTAYGHWIEAVLGNDAETHLDYFRRKDENSNPSLDGDAPARALVKLLIATGRNEEALRVTIEKVQEGAPYGMPVPTALQLCYTAKDFKTLKEIARERGDLLSYVAGAILQKAGHAD